MIPKENILLQVGGQKDLFKKKLLRFLQKGEAFLEQKNSIGERYRKYKEELEWFLHATSHHPLLLLSAGSFSALLGTNGIQIACIRWKETKGRLFDLERVDLPQAIQEKTIEECYSDLKITPRGEITLKRNAKLTTS